MGRDMKTVSSLLYFENPNQGLPVFNISSWALGMLQRLGEGLVKNLFQDPNYECMWHSGLALGSQPAVWLGEKAQCQLPASPASTLRTRWMWAHSLRNRGDPTPSVPGCHLLTWSFVKLMFTKDCDGLHVSTPAQNSYVEILIPKVMIGDDGDSGQWRGHEGEALLNWIMPLSMSSQRNSLSFYYVISAK